ncbi:hypothetical protein [Belliella pelovolcani]|uniref:TolB-like 6-blade propeller-like n=1 Tax=Belliella pelovolcani TaxID=529505 RepID=A0A1N7KP90_9BACT|nr:hypothetical protein [Belliella pelovolcani]SIS63377.1 hypothetical protein SAMN05421761_102239 [Belliella pelovolcani]
MKNLIFGITIITFSLCFISCKKNSSQVSYEDQKSFSLVIEDSILVEYLGVLGVIDFNKENNRYLAKDYNYDGQVFVVFDEQGTVINTFDNRIAGSNAYKGSLYGVGFHLDGYMIASGGGVYYYNEHWEVVDFVPDLNTTDTYYNYWHKLMRVNENGGDSYLFLYRGNEESRSLEGIDVYLASPVFGRFDGEIFDHVFKTPKESIYVDPRYDFNLFVRCFAYSNYSRKFYFAFGSDPNLYRYDLEKDLIYPDTVINMNLEYYGMELSNFAAGRKEVFAGALDSRVVNLLEAEGRVFIAYSSAVDHKKFIGRGFSYDNSPESMEYISQEKKFVFTIFEDGQNKLRDVDIKGKLGMPWYAFDKNTLLFSPWIRDESLNGEVFYKVKVVLDEE